MKKSFVLITILLLIFFTTFYIFFYKKEEVIKIGFVGALTAKYSVLGNAMMNGIVLAFEEENYRINGKKIELIFKDDKKDIELNKKIVNDFILLLLRIFSPHWLSSHHRLLFEFLVSSKCVISFLLLPVLRQLRSQFSQSYVLQVLPERLHKWH